MGCLGWKKYISKFIHLFINSPIQLLNNIHRCLVSAGTHGARGTEMNHQFLSSRAHSPMSLVEWLEHKLRCHNSQLHPIQAL